MPMNNQKYFFLVLLLGLSSCGGDEEKKGQGHHPPPHYGSPYNNYGAGGPNWNNYQQGTNWWQQYPAQGGQGGGIHFSTQDIVQRLKDLQEKIADGDDFRSIDNLDGGAYRYREFERYSGWRRAFGKKCYQKVKGQGGSFDRGFDSEGITHELGTTQVQVHNHLKSLVSSAQHASEAFGNLHYIRKDGVTYGIDFSWPLLANPVCKADLGKCSGYSLETDGKNFPCFP